MCPMPESADPKLDAISTALLVHDASGELHAASARDVLGAAHAVIDELYAPGTALGSPEAARRYLSIHYAGREEEVFS